MAGGSIDELKERLLKEQYGSEGSPYKTPKIDNVFEIYDDFQAASAAVGSFNDNPEEPLRKPKQSPGPRVSRFQRTSMQSKKSHVEGRPSYLKTTAQGTSPNTQPDQKRVAEVLESVKKAALPPSPKFAATGMSE